MSRITTGVPILHPQVFSFSGLWEEGRGASERLYRHTPDTLPVYENSPIRIVYDGGGPVRCDPYGPPSEGEFDILADLRAAGFTDYIVLPAPFSDGTTKAVSIATRKPERFSDGDIALFGAMMPALAMNLEVQALRRTRERFSTPISANRPEAAYSTARSSGARARRYVP